MKEDIWRFTGVLLFSLVTGILTGQVALCLLAGCLLYLFWQYRLFRQILIWLQTHDDSKSPESPGLIDAICREIDYLKERQRLRNQSLADYLKRYQEASAALPDAIVILRENGVIEWANDKANEYLGIRWPQDNMQRINNLIRHPEIAAFLNKAGIYRNRDNLQHESPVNPELALEFRLVPYGEHHKLLMARDITSIQRINQMRKDFIANASHELRSPLTVISGYLEGFASDDDFPAAFKSQVEQMRKQSERMQRLIEDLLTLSSLESRERKEQDEVVHLPELLATVYQEAQTLGDITGHVLYLETDPDLWLKGSQRELYSAFSNLVFNAVQHTPANGVIRIRWYADEKGAHFEVEDNGPGIPAEHIPRITERFYRVDKGRSRERGGTGLGLAIVKHVLVRHQAHLQIESQVGSGSKFMCHFPKKMLVNRHDKLPNSMTA
ncbi:MAG TPA: phosphate regulon sensor histidine kinase PhoR [Gammaproteobacteria bacterium]|nr:phosphate regulon sensor histidine kinase PhoR [Gammaproteobacteria bacterium]